MERAPRARARKSGQSVMIVAVLVAFGVLIGFVALAFDGGSALLQRRTQQNAAEAGALAGIKMMQEGVLGSCDPPGCRPTYQLMSADLIARVASFVRANRGGTVGATEADYTMTIEYHYMAGAAVPPAPCADCYQPMSSAIFVPDYVDGLRVKATIDNPTTFLKAFMPNQQDSLRVTASAAARLYPTCDTPPAQGFTLPFTRFRPALENEITEKGNSLCDPFIFWYSQGDIGGGNSNFKNLISLNQSTFHPVTTTQPIQLLTAFDLRYGPSPPGAGLNIYQTNATWQPALCAPADQPCADMRGSGQNSGSSVDDDIGNWIAWQWQGMISTTHQYPQDSMTYYPANPSTDGGRNGGQPTRPGDWAETDYSGNHGQNIQEGMHDLARLYGTDTPLSPPTTLNWGRAITRTIFVWGDPQSQLPSDKSSQDFVSCTGGNCTSSQIWSDVNITGNPNAGWKTQGNPSTIRRVRFTRAYTFVFYENMQGNYGACDPPGCAYQPTCSLPNLSGSQAIGFLANQTQPGPNGSCGWQPHGATYTGQVPP